MEEVNYKLGDKVKLHNTGWCYSGAPLYDEVVKRYCRRYNPCNVKKRTIYSGYESSQDLALREDLRWKIRYKVPIFYDGQISVWLISSNQNHVLAVGDKGISKKI